MFDVTVMMKRHSNLFKDWKTLCHAEKTTSLCVSLSQLMGIIGLQMRQHYKLNVFIKTTVNKKWRFKFDMT